MLVSVAQIGQGDRGENQGAEDKARHADEQENSFCDDWKRLLGHNDYSIISWAFLQRIHGKKTLPVAAATVGTAS